MSKDAVNQKLYKVNGRLVTPKELFEACDRAAGRKPMSPEEIKRAQEELIQLTQMLSKFKLSLAEHWCGNTGRMKNYDEYTQFEYYLEKAKKIHPPCSLTQHEQSLKVSGDINDSDGAGHTDYFWHLS